MPSRPARKQREVHTSTANRTVAGTRGPSFVSIDSSTTGRLTQTPCLDLAIVRLVDHQVDVAVDVFGLVRDVDVDGLVQKAEIDGRGLHGHTDEIKECASRTRAQTRHATRATTHAPRNRTKVVARE